MRAFASQKGPIVHLTTKTKGRRRISFLSINIIYNSKLTQF